MMVERNLTGLLIRDADTVRVGLGRINATPHLIQLVVNADGVMVGTLTDGDIRRGLLNGCDLNSPVAACMSPSPRVARTYAGALEELSRLRSSRRAVPVVDDAGRPQYLVASSGSDDTIAAALVMAGGFGRRLGRITESLPKPLVPVNGVPILGHTLMRLADAGVGNIYVAVHYLREQIRDYVKSLAIAPEVTLIEEDPPLGTAGAIGLLPRVLNGTLLVINGDIMTRADFGAMLAHHRSQGSDLTVAAARYEFEIPFGVIQYDGEGRLESITEKPRHASFVSAGLYLMEPGIRHLVERGVRIDMPELFLRAKQSGHRVDVFAMHEAWIDVGRPDDIRLAETYDRESREH